MYEKNWENTFSRHSTFCRIWILQVQCTSTSKPPGFWCVLIKIRRSIPSSKSLTFIHNCLHKEVVPCYCLLDLDKWITEFQGSQLKTVTGSLLPPVGPLTTVCLDSINENKNILSRKNCVVKFTLYHFFLKEFKISLLLCWYIWMSSRVTLVLRKDFNFTAKVNIKCHWQKGIQNAPLCIKN